MWYEKFKIRGFKTKIAFSANLIFGFSQQEIKS